MINLFSRRLLEHDCANCGGPVTLSTDVGVKEWICSVECGAEWIVKGGTP